MTTISILSRPEVFPIRSCLKIEDDLVSNYGPPEQKVVAFNINVVVWNIEDGRVNPCPQFVKIRTSPDPVATVKPFTDINSDHPGFQDVWEKNVNIRPFIANLVGSPYPQSWWKDRP